MTSEVPVNPFQSITSELIQPEDSSFVQQTLDVTTIIDSIEHMLKGEVQLWSEKKDCWIWEPKGEKQMNEMGVKAVMTTISFHVNKDIILSTLTQDEIRTICNHLHVDLALQFVYRSEEFGIKKANRNLLISSIMNLIYVTLKRAIKGDEKLFLSKTQRSGEVKQISVGDQKQKSTSLWNVFGSKR